MSLFFFLKLEGEVGATSLSVSLTTGMHCAPFGGVNTTGDGVDGAGGGCPFLALSIQRKHTGTSSRSFGCTSVYTVTSAQQMCTILLHLKHLCVGLSVKFSFVHSSRAQHRPF